MHPTDLYQKRSLLYGVHLAQQPIVAAGEAVVVEGYIDAVAAHQAGFTNVVATGGTALTTEHIEMLGEITGNVTLAFDGDQAGLAATERTAALDPASRGIHMSVARLPPNTTPPTSSPTAEGTSSKKPSPTQCLLNIT